MQTLTRTGIQIPDQLTDAFTYRAHLAAIAQAVEQQSVIFLTGMASQRPAAGKAGRVWMSTDTGDFWWDTGGAWMLVNPDPPANDEAGTPSLRSLGTAAGTAAAGTHSAQHAPGGADPLPEAPVGMVTRGDTLGYSGPTTIVWQGPASPYWSAASPNRIKLPHPGAWLVEITADPIFGPSPDIGCSGGSGITATGCSQQFIGVASWLIIAEGVNASAIFEIRPNGDGNASGFSATAAHIG